GARRGVGESISGSAASIAADIVVLLADQGYEQRLDARALGGERADSESFGDEGAEEPGAVVAIAAELEHDAPAVDANLRDVRMAAEPRSEEHTSELQSRENLVCRLLLEKKK